MSGPPTRSTARPGRFEDFATRALTTWNRTPATKRWVSWFTRHVSHRWIQWMVRPRLVVKGEPWIRDFVSPRGILLVGNHRTFWDMYIATSVFTAYSEGTRDLYFPIRRRFFYTHPLGVLMNLAAAGGSMWPPMAAGFDRRRRDQDLLEELAEILARPNQLAGIHPEGTRSHREDPLDLLPAKGGAGRLLQACHPETTVLPYFLSGASNNLAWELALNYRRPERRPPITLAFGKPELASTWDRSGAPRTVASRMLERVRALGEEALR